MAVLQAGAYPLWFQFTDQGPVLLETIEDACFSAAFVPWPHAPYIRFILARGDELLMALNHDGFISFSPWKGGTGLYRFSGGEFWRQYTVGAFVLYEGQPAALLYRDDRFLDSDSPLPEPRLWTFDYYSTKPKPLAMPALDAFAIEEGWDVDTLRQGGDDYWYFRAIRKDAIQPEIRMLRGAGLGEEGSRVALDAFQNSALPQPLSAAPPLLSEMLSAAFVESGAGLSTIVSPEFETFRAFAQDHQSTDVLHGFYSVRPQSSGAFLLTIDPQGGALYLETSAFTEGGPSVRRFSLPPLPEGFVYTGIGLSGDTIIASWEEQEEYSIAAAGFMVIKFTQ